MTIKLETQLKDFNFWGPAEQNVDLLTWEELEELDAILGNYAEESDYIFTATELNDLFAYDFENVCALIGLDADEVRERGN